MNEGWAQRQRNHTHDEEVGTPGGIRTPDPLVRSQMLYPLSYGRTVGEYRSDCPTGVIKITPNYFCGV